MNNSTFADGAFLGVGLTLIACVLLVVMNQLHENRQVRLAEKRMDEKSRKMEEKGRLQLEADFRDYMYCAIGRAEESLSYLESRARKADLDISEPGGSKDDTP